MKPSQSKNASYKNTFIYVFVCVCFPCMGAVGKATIEGNFCCLPSSKVNKIFSMLGLNYKNIMA